MDFLKNLNFLKGENASTSANDSNTEKPTQAPAVQVGGRSRRRRRGRKSRKSRRGTRKHTRRYRR
jgi:hypothetical protein